MIETFNKGDRVRYVVAPGRGTTQERDGKVGTVKAFEPTSVVVQLDGESFALSYWPQKFDLVERAVPATVTPIKPTIAERAAAQKEDVVNSPSHYTQYPHEVIEFTEHMDFCKGNAVKYIARAGFKGGPEKEIEDLEKAAWYIKRKIEKLKREQAIEATAKVYEGRTGPQGQQR